MVRCMLNGKVYETCRPEETESDDETSRATKIIEHEFDETGRARVKVVYVDVGEFRYDYPKGKASEADASMHIQIIISREEEKERMEGTPCPLLIFVLQNRDYWPGSDNDPGVMARRAAKEKAYNLFKSYMPRPDSMNIHVPPMTKHHDPSLGSEIGSRTGFWERFDPSLPVNKYILANMDDIPRTELNEGLIKAYNEFKSYMPRPDSTNIHVPPMTKHHDPSLGSEIGERFDPSLPVNKYILANMDDIPRTELNEGLLTPDLRREWNEWMGTAQVDKALDGLNISSGQE